MLGICPNCKIKLKIPPFRDRETNEVLIVMIYRNKIDNNIQIKSIKEIGYCEICKAREKDIQEQIRFESNRIKVIN